MFWSGFLPPASRAAPRPAERVEGRGASGGRVALRRREGTQCRSADGPHPGMFNGVSTLANMPSETCWSPRQPNGRDVDPAARRAPAPAPGEGRPAAPLALAVGEA